MNLPLPEIEVHVRVRVKWRCHVLGTVRLPGEELLVPRAVLDEEKALEEIPEPTKAKASQPKE